MVKLSQDQLTMLKEEYGKLIGIYQSQVDELFHKHTQEDGVANRICPKCHNDNNVDSIKRIQGEVKGEFHSSSDYFLFGGFSSSSGSLEGQLDTNPVHKCTKCGNEWKYTAHEYSDDAEEVMRSMFYPVFEYFKFKKQADEAKFDPDDLTEKFNSLDEKVKYYVNQAKDKLVPRSVLRDYPAMTITQFLKNKGYNLPSYIKDIREWDESYFEEWGCKKIEQPKIEKKKRRKFLGIF